ncbi:MAG: type IV secretory system conjugative DNA transfer family protein [Hyphomicrobiales bacterium]|nr:type IV secretory system conjugative DNA transfer family protein [Hyphomicrobiales bacterium]MDE2116211.1 type IV secretory system conjugative DNA transfer family protein [Hyphomicrobiales bacterium]
MSDSLLARLCAFRITRPRTWAFRVSVGLLGSGMIFWLWSIAYLIVAAFRYNPGLFPSEGATRWTLLRMQSQARGWTALFIAWNHFYVRLFFASTREEALIRALMALGIASAVVAAAIIFVHANRKPIHLGDAALGSIMDAEEANLTSRHGVALGRLGGVLLRSDAPAHMLVIGPTRSGKGVSFIVPNGFLWEGSSVWFDPKRENFDRLSGYRNPSTMPFLCGGPVNLIRTVITR